ncbi:helix-turn-helix domain-containing protein [Paenibacillus urinalis]|uniref:Helix-turn-helix domain-containing protein n=1 Tax=Paenibacillus urinalis TaxID=521520 RepID=A0ABY7XD42_9BACL|nr:transcriptional regulator [Paenibacillus urinalis]WDH95313.1 helix-turn-helix domain-containing protein [Paenibacillus urinalis]WDI03508.1 helix-turn-helix domain-containing protein [Paenibacillus urinalis]
MNSNSIYLRIEELINKRGMTKKAFCEELKISTGNLGDWKRGQSIPSTAKLIEIAAFFDVSLDWIMVGRSEMMINEQSISYEAEDHSERQAERAISELTVKEQEFIKEYIEFTRYRKQKRADKHH